MTHKTWELITLLGDMLVWSLANARSATANAAGCCGVPTHGATTFKTTF